MKDAKKCDYQLTFFWVNVNCIDEVHSTEHLSQKAEPKKQDSGLNG